MISRNLSYATAVAAFLMVGGCDAPPASPPAARVSQPDQDFDGKALYKERCGMCHQGIGMATALLARRPGDTSEGLLEKRKDLSVEFITTVTRTGIGNMPRIPRGEVSDPEMTAIATYLTQDKQ